MMLATCHPDRSAKAKGLCGKCYNAERKQAGPRATCHPSRLRNTRDGLCQVCSQKRHHATNASSLERRRAWRNERKLQSYGITQADYDALLAAQNGVCAICKQARGTAKKTRLCVDHCHQTGKVRGLLCDACNRGIGLFGDDHIRVAVAAGYLVRMGREFTSGARGETVGRGCE